MDAESFPVMSNNFLRWFFAFRWGDKGGELGFRAVEGPMGLTSGHMKFASQVELCISINDNLFILATAGELVSRLSPTAAKWRLQEQFQLVAVDRSQMKRAHCWKTDGAGDTIILEHHF